MSLVGVVEKMTSRGSGVPVSLYLFDDALVFARGGGAWGRAAGLGVAGGLPGAVVAGVVGRKRLRRQREAITPEAAATLTSEEFVRTSSHARRVPSADVDRVEVSNSFRLRESKLTVHLAGGERIVYGFPTKHEQEACEMLASVFGDRFGPS